MTSHGALVELRFVCFMQRVGLTCACGCAAHSGFTSLNGELFRELCDAHTDAVSYVMLHARDLKTLPDCEVCAAAQARILLFDCTTFPVPHDRVPSEMLGFVRLCEEGVPQSSDVVGAERVEQHGSDPQYVDVLLVCSGSFTQRAARRRARTLMSWIGREDQRRVRANLAGVDALLSALVGRTGDEALVAVTAFCEALPSVLLPKPAFFTSTYLVVSSDDSAAGSTATPGTAAAAGGGPGACEPKLKRSRDACATRFGDAHREAWHTLGRTLACLAELARGVLAAYTEGSQQRAVVNAVAECVSGWHPLVRALKSNRPLVADAHPRSLAYLKDACAKVRSVCDLGECGTARNEPAVSVVFPQSAQVDELACGSLCAAVVSLLDRDQRVRANGGGRMLSPLVSVVALAALHARVVGSGQTQLAAAALFASSAVSFVETIIRKCDLCVTPSCLWRAQEGISSGPVPDADCRAYWQTKASLVDLPFDERRCPRDLLHPRNAARCSAVQQCMEAAQAGARLSTMSGETFVASMPRCGAFVRQLMPMRETKGAARCDATADEVQECSKANTWARRSIPGVLVVCCPHKRVLGVSAMHQNESPALVLRVLRERVRLGTKACRARVFGAPVLTCVFRDACAVRVRQRVQSAAHCREQ